MWSFYLLNSLSVELSDSYIVAILTYDASLNLNQFQFYL